jgi:methylmalonyl-CoA mutase
MSSPKTKLFDEFPPITPEQWEQIVISDLKGADYEKKLISRTIDGIPIKPYYTSKDTAEYHFTETNPGEFPFLRGNDSKHSHEIRQTVFVEDYPTTAVKAGEIIGKGADSVEFVLCRKENITVEDFEILLSGIDMTKNPVHLRAARYSADILDSFVLYCKKKYQSPEQIKGSLNFDILGFQAISGKALPELSLFTKTKSDIESALKTIPNFKLITVNGLFFRDAGASPVQELAFAFSSAVEYLHHATEAGLRAEQIIPRIAFSFGTGSDYFVEIAKIRAARVVWAKIAETYCPDNIEAAKMTIHSTTCNRNKTVYDPHVNILRTTTEAMSAILGGTDSLTVRPFDSVYKTPDDFSERIARNIQIILKEEAYFDKSTDVAGGAYFIEYLTQAIIEKTWNLFLELENAGGYSQSLKKEIIQNIIGDSVQKQMMNIAGRREILLGTNQYADASEKAERNIDRNVLNKEHFKNAYFDFKPLTKFRGAAEFEDIRLKTENAEKRPKVFLLTIGNPAMRKARASFAANFFACAGFEIIDNTGFKTIAEGVEAAMSKNADITVLCGADDEYPNYVQEAYALLKDKSVFVVAGYPTDSIENLKAIGISNFIHIKSNIVEDLKKYQNQLTVKK